MLKHRLIFGSLLAVAVLALLITDGVLAHRTPPAWWVGQIHLGRWLFQGTLCTLVAWIFCALATHELVHFGRAGGKRPFGLVSQVFAAGLVLGPYLAHNVEPDTLHPIVNPRDEAWGLLWMSIALGVTFLIQAVRKRTDNAMGNLATTIFIIFYAGGLTGYMTKLRMEVGGYEGVVLLIFSIFVVKMTDVGAFFIGSAIGRHKMIEWLSPKKTWEGLAGGCAVAVACALAAGSTLHATGVVDLNPGQLGLVLELILFGLLMASFSVAGDLCASLLKRDAAMKDSGQVFPGLGGVLDVLDSPLLAAPAAWFFWTRIAQVQTSGWGA